jgi:hypothetical protein
MSLIKWIVGLLQCVVLIAQASAQNADELAKKLSNPIASLTSVPLQLNYDETFGSEGKRTLLNVQPVIPVSIGTRWNMISRTIIPLIQQRNLRPSSGKQSGLGDVTQSLFLSPKSPTSSGWVWGAGPALLLRTASDDLLGAGKWAAGPTAVALKQASSGLTYGALANHLWSFAGDDNRADISATFVQPFLSKAMSQGRTISLNIESSYDWKAGQWSVPLNVGYSKVTRLGTQLISYQTGARYYIEGPTGGPEWGLRFTFTLLFPKG